MNKRLTNILQQLGIMMGISYILFNLLYYFGYIPCSSYLFFNLLYISVLIWSIGITLSILLLIYERGFERLGLDYTNSLIVLFGTLILILNIYSPNWLFTSQLLLFFSYIDLIILPTRNKSHLPKYFYYFGPIPFLISLTI